MKGEDKIIRKLYGSHFDFYLKNYNNLMVDSFESFYFQPKINSTESNGEYLSFTPKANHYIMTHLSTLKTNRFFCNSKYI